MSASLVIRICLSLCVALLQRKPTSIPGNGMISDPVAIKMFLVAIASVVPSCLYTVTYTNGKQNDVLLVFTV